PNEFNFGGLAGSTNIIMRASKYREGGKISYAAANRSYRGRVSASYNSGVLKNGWAYSVLFTRRFGEEGFRDGTLYDANSFFAVVEKQLGENNSLNFMAYYVPYRRGKSSANTQEVYDLKGTKYNSYWGYQGGEIRNSRIKRFNEPVVMLNHYWDISEKTRLNTNLAYKFGESGSSRLGYDDAPNPDPAYYRKLPSYALAQDPPNLALAYENYSNFVNDGQIDWKQLYRTNLAFDGPARYYLYEDRTDDQQIYANTILNSQLTNNIKLTAALRYRNLNSENFAYMLDLLGAENYLDVDTFSSGDEAQSDLQNPNRLVGEEERFNYNYELDATIYSGFAQAQFKYKKVDFHLAGKMGKTTYLRTGLYQNGNFPDNSLGESEELDFTNFGGKAGATYKITGRHFVQLNGGYFTKAPSLRNSFSNSRQNNDVVIGLEEEKIKSADLSYLFRSRIINARLTAYWSLMEDATEISFYYADGIASPVSQNQTENSPGLARNQTTAFVQEVLTGIEKRNIGAELGIEAQVTPTIKLKGAAAIGQFTYANNPNLYLTSDDFDAPLQYGESYLKNYHVAGGPERAYQIGFEYRDPDYWFFGVTTNYFSNAYIDVAPITRTQNFYLDVDGVPFNDYDPQTAERLLKQEQFGDYFLVNFIGGKSWKIDDYYIGFFGVISNVLDETYKTGGFEQGRSANYRELLTDTSNDPRVFGPKYWYGYGTTFYLNCYIRF
ncbi:MAG TPA: TonB-dependent receptor, partial [Flavobacteriaceae bacterium]|nr:TonB-dependent receptor [Flavobacteriaceae bacterium]